MIALSVATAFTPVLALSSDLRVHSIFTSGFNLRNESGTLIWVAPLSDAAYPASLGLDLDRDRWLNLGITAKLTPGEPVHATHASSTVLTFAGVSLIIDKDTTLQSTKLSSGAVVNRLGYSTEITQAIDADRRTQPHAHDLVIASVDEHLSHALIALGGTDDEAAGAHLRHIVGLGFGLTPTGDDAVIGALGFTRMFDANLFQRLSAAVTPLLDRTTAISATYLALAAQGHFSRPLADTLQGYVRDPSPGALSGLLSLGHSSGVDTARGILISAALSPTPLHLPATKEFLW